MPPRCVCCSRRWRSTVRAICSHDVAVAEEVLQRAPLDTVVGRPCGMSRATSRVGQKMSIEDDPKKPRDAEATPEWHRARAKDLRRNGFTKMAEQHPEGSPLAHFDVADV